MRLSLRILFFVLAFALGATSVFAQGYPRWHHYGAPSPGGYMFGPAYGWPGEPLGPAYWNENWPSNPRTCGPGLCQDDPRY
jgi:hypothetical protein